MSESSEQRNTNLTLYENRSKSCQLKEQLDELRLMRRTVPIMFSMIFVQASDRLSSAFCFQLAP
jgi:hypothetical protein